MLADQSRSIDLMSRVAKLGLVYLQMWPNFPTRILVMQVGLIIPYYKEVALLRAVYQVQESQ